MANQKGLSVNVSMTRAISKRKIFNAKQCDGVLGFASQAHLICLIESMDADLNPDLLNHFDSGVNYFL